MPEISIESMVTNEDMEGKAYVHWRSWHETYTGLIDHSYLERWTLERCVDLARRWPQNLIVAKDCGRVIGFAGFGAYRDDALEGYGEVFSIYVLAQYHGKRVGYALMNSAMERLACYDKIAVWVLKGNEKGIRFYERYGFRFDGTEKEVNLGTPNKELRMVYTKSNSTFRKYYAAYDERYKTAHAHGVRWSSDAPTPLVMEVIKKYDISHNHRLLEIGCGEGRDSAAVLKNGYNLTATDISNEAIAYCKKIMPQFANHFNTMDFLSAKLDSNYDFIFGIAVIHMLVLDEDRNGFYRFIHDHLNAEGIALICTMGDGEYEMQSDISEAFTLKERNHESGKMLVAGTSCRMVSFRTFENELIHNDLTIIEKGITSALPNFNSLMYAVVKCANLHER